MEKFVYLFKGGMDNSQTASPEAMQAHMQKWNEWMQKLMKDGNMLGETLFILKAKEFQELKKW